MSAPRSTRVTTSTPTSTARHPGRPRILVIGDSLVTLSAAPLDLRLRAAGWDPTVLGVNGWRLDQLDDLYRTIDRALPQWDAVVMWAGNNDILQRDPWRDDLRTTVGLLARERCAVLVGISEVYWAEKLGIPRPDTPVSNPEAQAFNVEAARSAAHARLGFVPWQRAIHTDQPWFHWDLIHVTAAGAGHAAELITRAAQTCRP
jgi:hypothetical protein